MHAHNEDLHKTENFTQNDTKNCTLQKNKISSINSSGLSFSNFQHKKNNKIVQNVELDFNYTETTNKYITFLNNNFRENASINGSLNNTTRLQHNSEKNTKSEQLMTNLDMYYQRMKKLGSKIDTFNLSYDSKYAKINKKLDQICSKINTIEQTEALPHKNKDFYVKLHNGTYEKCDISDIINKKYMCSDILKDLNQDKKACGHGNGTCQFKTECLEERILKAENHVTGIMSKMIQFEYKLNKIVSLLK